MSQAPPALLRAVLDAFPAAVVVTDAELGIVHGNEAACQLFGYPSGELAELKLEALLGADSPPLPGEGGRSELVWLRKGGGTFCAEVTRRGIRGTPSQLLILADGAEGRRLEAELVEASRLLTESRESERLRLARELHDGAIQELIGIGFSLTEVERCLREAAPHLDLEPIRRQRGEVLRVVRLLRALVSELRPAGLEEFGLLVSIEGLVAKLIRDQSAAGPKISLDLQEVIGLTDAQQLCLFRAAQECLYNCLNHAQAENVRVVLRSQGSEMMLMVSDDGCGFQVPRPLKELARGDHYGLAGMAERVELVGGKLEVESHPGRGTRVCVLLKLDREERHADRARR